LTLTLPALAAAELSVVAAFGATKADAVRAVLHDPSSTLPVARALSRARRALVLLDPEASRQHNGREASAFARGFGGPP
jgi:6-phosphogluconolactonase/glucosamine-6-phosphate isomerase/deaminase